MRKPMTSHENYLAGGISSAILPIGDLNGIILVIGIIIVIIAVIFIFRSYKRKLSNDKFQKRFSGLKSQFNDIKDEGIAQKDIEWLNRDEEKF